GRRVRALVGRGPRCLSKPALNVRSDRRAAPSPLLASLLRDRFSMPDITSRDYAGPQDLCAMQALIQATWTRAAHLHIGDLVWQRYPRAASPDWQTRLWFDGEETVAWSW